MIYLHLFLQFFKTGLFSIGGGLATFPFLREMTLHYDWFTLEDLVDMIAVSESTPGPIGINMATYAGYNAAGILGGIVATFSLVLPSIIIIIIIASFMGRFQNSQLVQGGFYALRPATAGLIAGAMFEVLLLSLFNPQLYAQTKRLPSLLRWPALFLFAALLLLIRKFPKIHPLVFILAGAVVGIVLQL